MCSTADGLHWGTLWTPSGTQKLAKGNVGMECADIRQAGQLHTGTKTNQEQVVIGGLVRKPTVESGMSMQIKR